MNSTGLQAIIPILPTPNVTESIVFLCAEDWGSRMLPPRRRTARVASSIRTGLGSSYTRTCGDGFDQAVRR